MPVPKDLPRMQYRFLGRSGLQVSAISLGGWLTYGGHVENENTFSCMKAAYDVGINFFDCAESYSNGESERVMGQAIKKFGWKRNDIVVSTKIYWGEAFGENPVNNRGLSRKHVVEGLNGSLERLGLEYVDIVFAHRPDRDTPIEETVRAFNHVINTGKAFYWGTSEWDADEIATAWRYADKLGLIGPVAEQPQYNMFSRNKVEKDFAHLYEEVGLGLTIWSPLKVGILTGKYNNGIPENSRLANSTDPSVERMRARIGGKEWDTFISVVAKLKPIADRLEVSQPNLAMAWVLANKNVSSAITGASRPDQIYESVKSLVVIEKLTPEILAEIDGILGNKPPVVKRRSPMS
ncbi:voltage-gated K channel beta subunit, putative [Talaromyces stipitatus ATCC 10500]|uniref:Voltage-gated K channel beta subunit, putative n=1 Tax=Talaromyces stipitatus (strain ATCC 10500 / CBS 375.48 / QM 6759 / NRRL 1006) TaxID=441959 RepID=B8MAH4_TALSN|nr:voltage-gated K channel beta subunit, putative [Talaromyces stipitatus ATCC 10500]EED17398.1 voltage-gated K channel beta subunit, putative [Talaromyces stipitatus ATCC 10500]